jgi:putative flippase GtrA
MSAGRDPHSRSSKSEVALFLLVGGSAALLYIALATLLELYFGLARTWASAFAYGSTIPIAYSAQKKLTFRSSVSHATAFPRYLATQLVALVTTSIVSGKLAELPPPLAYGIAGACAAIVSFLLLKFWGFSGGQPKISQ